MDELILLGTGTCSVTAARSMASQALITDGGLVLVDTGPGCIRRMAEAGLSVHYISAIFYTHFHGDHVGDLAPILFSRMYDPLGPGPGRLTIGGPIGLAKYFEGLCNLFPGKNYNEDFPPVLHEFSDTGDDISFGHLTIKALGVKHREHSLGYRIEGPGYTVAFSGDTEPCTGLVKLARNADAFVCDCSVPDEAQVPGHMSPEHVGQVAREANCKKVVLTHMYPMMENLDLVELVSKEFDGEVVRGEDGMRFGLGPPRTLPNCNLCPDN